MKKLKRPISFVMLLCILFTLLPPVHFTRAAEVVQRYELDLDGIDPGATYLIVNTGNAGTGNALKFRYGSYSSQRSFINQSLTVQTDENGTRYIAKGFTDEEDCTFQFSAESSGKITHVDGNTTYTVDLTNGRFSTSSNPQTLTFTSAGNGAYQIHYTTSSWFSSNTYYLQYSSSSWARSRANTASSVYLYKLVEYEVGVNIRFDSNGATSGELPPDKEKLDKGTPYTIPYPPVELRKDIGQDTWLFLCWNTKPDGSGIEYEPGEEITVTEDLTLYADWYQQTKYNVAIHTALDGVHTDVTDISGQNKTFAIQKKDGDGTFIPLERMGVGIYSYKVVENGDYIVYSQVDGGQYEPVHGHMVSIYNADGFTECQHFTVNYNTNGGVWSEGQEPARQICHATETVTLTENVPTLAGNRFLGWKDQDGNTYAPGAQIQNVQKKIELTAIWEETIDITVNVIIDHNTDNDGFNNAGDMHQAILQFLRKEGEVFLPLDQDTLDQSHDSWKHDSDTHITTYTIVLKDQPQGLYSAVAEKSMYESTVTRTGAANEDQTITVKLTYAPHNFDLNFNVQVNADTAGEKALMPSAVNVKVSYWGYNDKNVLGWHIITQQSNGQPPVTVNIDKDTGKGTGSYTVWRYWANANYAYDYRLEITSFVMPDGSIVPATGDLETYVPNGSGLYEATVSIKNGGRTPTYPETDALPGAYFDGAAQAGTPTVTIEITPYTVTFDAGEGTVNNQPQLVLQEQYLYPDPSGYTAVATDKEKIFLGWYDENGTPAQELAGKYLEKNVVLTAKYGDNITLSGDVLVATHYTQDGQSVAIHEIDLPKEVMVLVRKQVGDQFITLSSQVIPVADMQKAGYITGHYEFKGLPNDGTQYQVAVVCVNYDSTYDNNSDTVFSTQEELAIVDVLTSSAVVDAQLNFNPEHYRIGLHVDASQIAPGFRPTNVLAQVFYRDLGDVHHFQVISQHTVPPYGVQMPMDLQAQGYGSEDVWIRHVDGTYYEYQIAVNKLYGSVEGAYLPGGTDFTENSPFTVEYGAPSSYLKQDPNGQDTLVATLVPKEYPIYLDLGEAKNANVQGMDDFLVDDGTDNTYAYLHTWSHASTFEAYPYWEGHVFLGWEETADTINDKELVVDDGVVNVGATLAKPVTLTAKWAKLTGTNYTVRHLELNTDKVLHGAQAVQADVAEGSRVVAADAALSIPGYVYAGAKINGEYIHKANNPALTITNNPLNNLLVIYYLPDSSSGYTEQVESNLSASKTATLENNGTYTITLDTYTKDNPITTKISNDTPLDVVLVLDQSGSMYQNGVLDDLQDAVGNFVTLLANHGRENEADHRIAIVGYASDEESGYSSLSFPTAGSDGYKWYNTGVFDGNGEFHTYNVTGLNYTEFTGLVTADGTYYTKSGDEYLLLTYHEEYRHLITEEEARQAILDNMTVYGYVEGQFVELTRNSSGLWLYGDKKLYSTDKYFTYHTNVWTHRNELDHRKIHAYGLGAEFKEVDGHTGIYTCVETKEANPQKNIYKDALMPVSLNANGSGGLNPGLVTATQRLGSNGLTFVSYGMEMANRVFEANPAVEGEKRLRIVIVFTDGNPGDGRNFSEAEANRAIAQSYIATHDHKADVYTVGLYGSDVIDAESDQVYFMNGLSSNYPDAKNLDDVWVSASYRQATSGYRLNMGGPYYVVEGDTYYELSLVSKYSNRVYYNCWGYTNNSGTRVNIVEKPVAEGHPIIIDGKVEGCTIYKKCGDGYRETPHGNYYSEAQSAVDLRNYFATVVQTITTNVTTKIILEQDTILRDIMGQGLVMTDNTVITVGLQKGNFNDATGNIDWSVDENGNPEVTEKVRLELKSGNTKASSKDGENSGEESKDNVQIIVYNYDSANPTDPTDTETYQPHAVDITGYNFSDWYISHDHKEGYKMIVTITGIEARDNVDWGRATPTNHGRSGLWLPADENGNRQLLMAFNQPSTIFVERAYVLDYGKQFTLSGWYFDDENGQFAEPKHLDLDVESGMNYFATPNTKSSVDGPYGNTKYGNVELTKDGNVVYTPTTMNWGGYDSFYVFGNTWRKTVTAQDANQNGNLWNKVTVIPANNIYYEDSFITTDNQNGQNDVEGITFDGEWIVVGTDSGNTEIPEHLETAPNGDVHGWTDSLGDDLTFTDGSAHFTNSPGASAEFVFTGTGVQVYTFTNAKSGMVVAVLSNQTLDENGKPTFTQYKSIAMDNLAVSGDYYHIPTVTFQHLPYGTYKLQLIATAATADSTGKERYEYYIDGVRVLNPLGNSTNYQSDIIKDAYGQENNAVFTEVRDILLDYGDFNPGIEDGTDGKMGAVFIDWVGDGVGVPTYDIGVFETYGPKNEVYLSAGQAIVLKVAEGNTYYLGLKSLSGGTVTASITGIDQADPKKVTLSHTTDMYYRITPVNGYIVVQNDGDALLSITNLRTTNQTAPVPNGGVLPLGEKEAVEVVTSFAAFMRTWTGTPENEPNEPEITPPNPQDQANRVFIFANSLFQSVRTWLTTPAEKEENVQ